MTQVTINQIWLSDDFDEVRCRCRCGCTSVQITDVDEPAKLRRFRCRECGRTEDVTVREGQTITTTINEGEAA
jgi:peptide subunit release factor 1 (eRF1)